ncbi:hypothetical protein Ciccas_006852, partial [Cichlidogyrus casuarinus]
MKLVLLFATLFAVSCLASDELELQPKWELFKSEHGKNYETETENQMRHKLWLDNLRMVEEHNKRYENGEVTYYLAQNRFSDMTTEEREQMNGFRMDERPVAESEYVRSGEKLDESWDWRTKNAVNPVRDQGYCGSCWAFSSIAAIETQYWLQKSSLKSFSEQQLVDCVLGTDCKNGGHMYLAFRYLRGNGLQSRDSYPYLDLKTRCKYDPTKIAMNGVANYVQLPHFDEVALAEAIQKVGVISIAVNTKNEDFHFYA